MTRFDFAHTFASRPVILAPMEDVSDAVFRRVCRARGAELCVTEFVHADALTQGQADAHAKIALAPDDAPTAIQIYGADASQLLAAAHIAAAAEPAYLDINCGCWVPKVARGGAGAGWLRAPDAMVAMAQRIAREVALPVTVKTRIGWGDERAMPIVDLARRLEDAGVRAITIHCRTAKMGHEGAVDWSWAARARAVLTIPVIVNGDIRSANDAQRALEQTGCAGVMIGRRAIEHPFIFREARARLAHARRVAAPDVDERVALCREHLTLAIDAYGERRGVKLLRRFYPGYLRPVPDAPAWIAELSRANGADQVQDILADLRDAAGAHDSQTASA